MCKCEVIIYILHLLEVAQWGALTLLVVLFIVTLVVPGLSFVFTTET